MNTDYNTRILLVEDSPLDTQLIENALVDLGYNNIIGVTGTADALEILKTSPPSLIIANILSEEQKTWLDLFDHIYDLIPVIVITASNEDSLYHELTSKGKVAYLIKPIHKLTLGATIKLLTK